MAHIENNSSKSETVRYHKTRKFWSAFYSDGLTESDCLEIQNSASRFVQTLREWTHPKKSNKKAKSQRNMA
jgi:hypothetical protein